MHHKYTTISVRSILVYTFAYPYKHAGNVEKKSPMVTGPLAHPRSITSK
jgi:hypothetical protein